jgi:hypothetical protein
MERVGGMLDFNNKQAPWRFLIIAATITCHAHCLVHYVLYHAPCYWYVAWLVPFWDARAKLSYAAVQMPPAPICKKIEGK